MTAYRIEPGQPADMPDVAAFAAAIQEHERARAPQLRPGAAVAEAYLAHLRERLAGPGGALLMARAGEAAIGFVCGWTGEDDDMLLEPACRQHGYISDLYVVPEWRRRGVAQALLVAMEAHFRAQGLARLRICSKAGNAEALPAYTAAGFVPYEVILERPLG